MVLRNLSFPFEGIFSFYKNVRGNISLKNLLISKIVSATLLGSTGF